MKVTALAVLATAILWCVCAAAQESKAPFTFDAMMKLKRIDDPQLSPDGKLVAFTVQTIDLPANSKPAQIYIVPLAGGAPRKLTSQGVSNSRPRWAPDSQRIFFVSDRAGEPQIWSMSADGTDQRQVTRLPTGADGEIVSPNGKLLVFTSEVYPQCEPQDSLPGVAFNNSCAQANLEAEKNSKMHARVYTSLLYRHWTTYEGKRRQHLLIQAADGLGNVRDLTPGSSSVPPFSLGGPEAYVFSRDSSRLTYVANLDRDLATSTNSDLYTVPVAGGSAKRLTNNTAADEGPVYSPDSKFLAYRTQRRAGYESDKWRLAVLDISSGRTKLLTDSLDRWVETYNWSPDSKNLFFTIDDQGTAPILKVPATGGAIETIAKGPYTVSSVECTADGQSLLYAAESGSHPVELFRAQADGGGQIALTNLNTDILDSHSLPPLEPMWVEGSGGVKIESFLLKPPGFDPAKKYPLLVQIHGGPQGDWGESWSYRWNQQVFAAAGFVVVLPNPRGSIGYGQQFTDAVNGDWGGVPYDDIMRTVDSASRLPYVDPDRMVAAGASYGGYMIDWILGHTDRFKALVSHDGVYDLRSETGTTEELWFPKWEFHGFPWENPAMYEKWSPSSYVKQFKTPTLVIQGDLDYRVPVGQGQQLFTALQERGVPSKLILFPDEGHWVLKPQSSQFWYANVIDWLKRYSSPAASVGGAARTTR